MKMSCLRAGLTLVACGLVTSGCSTASREPVFQTVPASAPETVPQAYPVPEDAPQAVRQKALAAYSKTYWFRIYPEMRSCTRVKGVPGYSASFGKSDQPLVGFPKEDTKWHGIWVEYDDVMEIVKLHQVRY